MCSIGNGNMLVVQDLGSGEQAYYLRNIIYKWIEDHQQIKGNREFVQSVIDLVLVNQSVQSGFEEEVAQVEGMKAFAVGMLEKKRYLSRELAGSLERIELSLSQIQSQISQLEKDSLEMLNNLNKQ
eukprot:TRINITY_DN7009_c1_g1_i2.p1 TRINITY_DN7009_c1_g1~~TRINITY_DN7009_c1_g1_i2.p1  ORF type:complete len:146 (+),score=10.32 TRINITY_DN7009_c1_g1_i2:61-438(+)